MILIKVPWLPPYKPGFTCHAITIAPFVFILPEYAANKAVIAHEQKHLDQIAQIGWPTWYWKYVTNHTFRKQQEDEAYEIQRKIEEEMNA